MGVNVSTHQLVTGSLVETVVQVLQDTGLSRSQLELEITESAIMQDDEETIKTLERLRSAGIALALDDFGTGYSSLSYLQRFPVGRIKIDRSFIKELQTSADDRALTIRANGLSQVHYFIAGNFGHKNLASFCVLQSP